MNLQKCYSKFLKPFIMRMLAFSVVVPSVCSGALEETFDVLQIGTHTYRNVTVTTKAKQYIVLMHSMGMNTIKISELPPDVRANLGYSRDTGAAESKANTPLQKWTTETVTKMKLPETKQLEKEWRRHVPSLAYARLTPSIVTALCWELVLLYLLISYCGMLICHKSGHPPGVLVWIPVLQLIPLLRAAGMSPAWLVAFMVPFLNIIAQIVWSMNIARARGKSAWVGIFLIVPLTTFFAYLYLALSGHAPKKQAARPADELMTLETA